MNQLARRITLASILVVLLLSIPAVASAQMRKFTGRIDRISNKKLIVDNRMGDKVSFIPVDETKVSGEGKEKWDDLKKGDWVTVSWKFVDKPRKAYEVEVLPPKEEAGEDE